MFGNGFFKRVSKLSLFLLVGLFPSCIQPRSVVATNRDLLPATKSDLQQFFGPIYAYDFATGAQVQALEEKINALEAKSKECPTMGKCGRGCSSHQMKGGKK